MGEWGGGVKTELDEMPKMKKKNPLQQREERIKPEGGEDAAFRPSDLSRRLQVTQSSLQLHCTASPSRLLTLPLQNWKQLLFKGQSQKKKKTSNFPVVEKKCLFFFHSQIKFWLLQKQSNHRNAQDGELT